MIKDPINELRKQLVDSLRTTTGEEVQADRSLATGAGWRPHVFEPSSQRAWHILAEQPESNAWITRIEQARAVLPDLRVAVCAPTAILQTESVLEAADRIAAEILPVNFDGQQYVVNESSVTSAADFIYEQKLRLTPDFASAFLDKYLIRVEEETNTTRKGVLLEVLTALLLSQVGGFEVAYRGVSSRTQQMDVVVHNRNTGGVLGRGQMVIAECKNWSNAVGRHEYDSLWRKLKTRRGLAKLGFLVTTDRLSRPMYDETLRDSFDDALIVLIHGELLPTLWRSREGITSEIERAAFSAAIDQRNPS